MDTLQSQEVAPALWAARIRSCHVQQNQVKASVGRCFGLTIRNKRKEMREWVWSGVKPNEWWSIKQAIYVWWMLAVRRGCEMKQRWNTESGNTKRLCSWDTNTDTRELIVQTNKAVVACLCIICCLVLFIKHVNIFAHNPHCLSKKSWSQLILGQKLVHMDRWPVSHRTDTEAPFTHAPHLWRHFLDICMFECKQSNLSIPAGWKNLNTSVESPLSARRWTKWTFDFGLNSWLLDWGCNGKIQGRSLCVFLVLTCSLYWVTFLYHHRMNFWDFDTICKQLGK